MSHGIDPFKDARLRVAAAQRHIAEYRAIIDRHWTLHADFDAERQGYVHKLLINNTLGGAAKREVANAVGSLRAALDLLTVACARLGGAPTLAGIHFPFVKDPLDWDRQIRRKCSHVPEAITEYYRTIRPYQARDDRLYALSQIRSNDRRWRIIVAVLAARVFQPPQRDDMIQIPEYTEPDVQHIELFFCPEIDKNCHVSLAVSVRFEGLPSLENQDPEALLQSLVTKVANVIDDVEGICVKLKLVPLPAPAPQTPVAEPPQRPHPTVAGMVRSKRPTFLPVGHCIYCGRSGSETSLTKEHIIPHGLGGSLVLPKSSCIACANITKEFERVTLRAMLGTIRARLGAPTRRPKERPCQFPLHIRQSDGTFVVVTLPIMEHPIALSLPIFNDAGILLGLQPVSTWDPAYWYMRTRDQDKDLLERYGGTGYMIGPVKLLPFTRMLAKIAHSYATATYGPGRFRPLLLDLVLGRTNVVTHLIGGGLADGNMHVPPRAEWMHDLDLQVMSSESGQNYLVAFIRLFAVLGAPEYHVVVGEVQSSSVA